MSLSFLQINTRKFLLNKYKYYRGEGLELPRRDMAQDRMGITGLN